MKMGWIGKGLGCVLALLGASAVTAGMVVYEEGDKKLEIGGRIQLQYVNTNPDVGQSRDTTFFRRLRPYIAGTVTEHWYGKIQFDFGKATDDDEVSVKDAYMRYSGFKNRNLKLYIGSTKNPFSREFLTSSKRQQLVERTFSGDHNFGTPDRQLGLRLDGKNKSKKVTYSAAFGSESHDPDVSKMDFDNPATRDSDWNEGFSFAGRVDFHPLGEVKFAQGDFRTDEWKYTIGASAFTWSNDDDNNAYTDEMTGMTTSTSKVDLDSANGFEVAAALRGHGFSGDLAVQTVSGDTVDSTFTGGIYRNGTTDLEKLTLEAGYMVSSDLEVAVGYETLDADNYATEWKRTSVSLNWFLNKHKAKVQLTYQMGQDENGTDGNDNDRTFLQTQFVF